MMGISRRPRDRQNQDRPGGGRRIARRPRSACRRAGAARFARARSARRSGLLAAERACLCVPRGGQLPYLRVAATVVQYMPLSEPSGFDTPDVAISRLPDAEVIPARLRDRCSRSRNGIGRCGHRRHLWRSPGLLDHRRIAGSTTRGEIGAGDWPIYRSMICLVVRPATACACMRPGRTSQQPHRLASQVRSCQLCVRRAKGDRVLRKTWSKLSARARSFRPVFR